MVTGDTRVKRHRVVVPENFVFPFQQVRDSDQSLSSGGMDLSCFTWFTVNSTNERPITGCDSNSSKSI